jgi:DNA polymerase-1
MPSTSPRLFVIDGNSYIYRAYYAIQHLSTSKGLPTNAVFGFTRMLLKVINQQQPEYLAIAFDHKAPTFRHKQYAEYKAHRPPMPEDLIPQIPYIKQIVKALNIPVLELAGYEADDIIGTLAQKAKAGRMQTVIVTGDKDIFQLLNEHIVVYDELKNTYYDPARVQEKFGVEVDKLTDLFGLVGDSSDNIPGVPGIGLKTAAQLINDFGSLENVLKDIWRVKGQKRQENLRQYADQARLSKALVTIHTKVPLKVELTDLARRAPDSAHLIELFKELELFSLIKEFSPKNQTDAKYHTIFSKQELAELLEKLQSSKGFALDLETTGKDPIRAEIVGISFCADVDTAYYIPLRHSYPGVPAQLDADYVLDRLNPIIADAGIKKYGQNIKYDAIVLRRAGLKLKGIDFDTMLASYLLNPSKRTHNLQDIALEHLNRKTTSYKELVGSGAKQLGFGQVDIAKATQYSAEDAEVTFALVQELAPKLKQADLEELFHRMEVPLVEVLSQMELWGVRIDADVLQEMSKELDIQLQQLSLTIYHLAGEEFNIDSPKQLGPILFEKLGLPAIKRTKTGYSTDTSVLQDLAMLHELPAKILEYRHLKKLKSTYVDALPLLINPQTGRLHTSFNQTVTATGRLSSSEPNLQNIPIRTELGRRIRQAFVPEPGFKLLAADYSQIELRILAHMSGDEGLRSTFRQGEDIHQRTAAEVFGVGLDKVTADMRRQAKVINFGILYGMSAYGLANDLKVGQREAQVYINQYFERYPGVKEFIDNLIKQAKSNGYVSTLFDRRRYIPELASKNRNIRQFGERTAINSPIQGTAADIIKLAMINIHHRLQRQSLKTRMILQVHDELIFEVPEGDIEATQQLVTQEMENAAQLDVPLLVNIKTGDNWAELE